MVLIVICYNNKKDITMRTNKYNFKLLNAHKLSWLLLIYILMLIGYCKCAILIGQDYGYNDLIPSDGDILQGAFTNVRYFNISQTTTVFISTGIQLKIRCDFCYIYGTINGNHKGNSGGSVNNNLSEGGINGTGIGYGQGGIYGEFIHGSGGGGGGYGNIGGNASSIEYDILIPSIGGIEYGNFDSLDVYNNDKYMGSGGGSGSNSGSDYESYGGRGGNGGGSIYISAETNIDINGGNIYCQGEDGQEGIYNPN